MHLNPTTDIGTQSIGGTPAEKVDDFKYLGTYANTSHDIDARLAQAWSALNSLNKIRNSDTSSKTKIGLFQK